MQGIVKIGEREIPMQANAATAIRYQQVFHKNLLIYFIGGENVADSTMAMQELAYIMARSAEGANMNALSYEDYLKWLEDFEPLSLVEDKTTDQVINIYTANARTSSAAKKQEGRPTEK